MTLGLFSVFFLSFVYSHPAKVMRNTLTSLNVELDRNEIRTPVELKFTSKPLKDIIVTAGEAFEFQCEATGIPPPVFHWSLNNKRVLGPFENTLYEKLHNVGRETIQQGVTVSKFSVPCADQSHAGIYKCVATNGHTKIERTAQVTVVGESQCVPRDSMNVAPKIVMWSDARFENEYNSVQFMCRTNSPASIAWYDEERRLLNELSGFEVFPNGDLMIKRAEWEHMGVYTCVASNEHGEDRITTFFYPTALTEQPDPKVSE